MPTRNNDPNKLETTIKCVVYFSMVSIRVTYLHHQDNSVQSDHDEHRVLKGRRGHKVPQSVLKGLPVLGHVAGHRLCADGEVDAGPLMWRDLKM